MVTNGVTLDLNGNVITASYLVSFGNVIDTDTEFGGVKVHANNAMITATNEYLPIYDSVGGTYRFFKAEVISKGIREVNDSTKTFGFAIRFANVEAYKVIETSEQHQVGSSGLNIRFVLSVTADRTYGFVYNSAARVNWATNAYTHYSDPNKTTDRALTMTVSGFSDDSITDDMGVTFEVKSASGALYTGFTDIPVPAATETQEDAANAN